jgi:hypothetical protein
VSFSLEVRLTYVVLTDRLVATKIANNRLLPDKEPEIKEAILEKLEQAGISNKLQRVAQTTYDLKNLKIAKKSTKGNQGGSWRVRMAAERVRDIGPDADQPHRTDGPIRRAHDT